MLAPVVGSTPIARTPGVCSSASRSLGSVIAPSRPHATMSSANAAFHMLFIRNEPLREMGPTGNRSLLRLRPGHLHEEVPPGDPWLCGPISRPGCLCVELSSADTYARSSRAYQQSLTAIEVPPSCHPPVRPRQVSA